MSKFQKYLILLGAGFGARIPYELVREAIYS